MRRALCRCRSGAGVEFARFVQLPNITSWDDIDFTVVMLNVLISVDPPASLRESGDEEAQQAKQDRSVSQFEVVNDVADDPETMEEFQSRLDDADYLALFEQFPISALLAHSFQSLVHPAVVPETATVLKLFSFVNHLIRLLARTFSDRLKSKFAVVTQFVAKQVSEVGSAVLLALH